MMTTTTVALDKHFYNLTQQAQGYAFYAAVTLYNNSLSEEEKANQPQNPLFQIRRGYAESPGWLMVQAAEFMPEPLTVDKLRVRAIWSSPSIMQAIMELLATEKWFDRIGDEYHLTDAGKETVANMQQRRLKPFENFVPMPQADIDRLEHLMRQVIDASLKSGDSQATCCLRYSRRRAPDDSAPTLAKIIQYGGDINAYRDDSHMAALRSANVDGRTWEAFSFVRDETAQTADALFEQLAYRGWTRTEWQESLDNLVERGWINLTNGHYVITDEGKTVDTDVERQTDAYFYAPWSVLADGETDELHELLTRLQESSQAALQQ